MSMWPSLLTVLEAVERTNKTLERIAKAAERVADAQEHMIKIAASVTDET